MKQWFVCTYGWYFPIHPWGWLISGGVYAFCVQICLVANAHTHSVSDFGYAVFPYVVPALLVLDRIAHATSRARP